MMYMTWLKIEYVLLAWSTSKLQFCLPKLSSFDFDNNASFSTIILKEDDLLLQRDRAMRLSVEILQLRIIQFEKLSKRNKGKMKL